MQSMQDAASVQGHVSLPPWPRARELWQYFAMNLDWKALKISIAHQLAAWSAGTALTLPGTSRAA